MPSIPTKTVIMRGNGIAAQHFWTNFMMFSSSNLVCFFDSGENLGCPCMTPTSLKWGILKHCTQKLFPNSPGHVHLKLAWLGLYCHRLLLPASSHSFGRAAPPLLLLFHSFSSNSPPPPPTSPPALSFPRSNPSTTSIRCVFARCVTLHHFALSSPFSCPILPKIILKFSSWQKYTSSKLQNVASVSQV